MVHTNLVLFPVQEERQKEEEEEENLGKKVVECRGKKWQSAKGQLSAWQREKKLKLAVLPTS